MEHIIYFLLPCTRAYLVKIRQLRSNPPLRVLPELEPEILYAQLVREGGSHLGRRREHGESERELCREQKIKKKHTHRGGGRSRECGRGGGRVHNQQQTGEGVRLCRKGAVVSTQSAKHGQSSPHAVQSSPLPLKRRFSQEGVVEAGSREAVTRKLQDVFA